MKTLVSQICKWSSRRRLWCSWWCRSSLSYVLPLRRLGGSEGGRANISNIHNGQFHTTRITSKGQRKLDRVVLEEMKLQAREVWKSSSAKTPTPRITSMLPVELGAIVVGRGQWTSVSYSNELIHLSR